MAWIWASVKASLSAALILLLYLCGVHLVLSLQAFTLYMVIYSEAGLLSIVITVKLPDKMLQGQSASVGQEFKNDLFSLIRKTDVWGLALPFKVTPPPPPSVTHTHMHAHSPLPPSNLFSCPRTTQSFVCIKVTDVCIMEAPMCQTRWLILLCVK